MPKISFDLSLFFIFLLNIKGNKNVEPGMTMNNKLIPKYLIPLFHFVLLSISLYMEKNVTKLLFF
jgi:hypothetical protein